MLIAHCFLVLRVMVASNAVNNIFSLKELQSIFLSQTQCYAIAGKEFHAVPSRERGCWNR